jgi:flagellum-specific ATP synthase
MIRAGLYAQGSDPEIDAAIQIWFDLDNFIARTERKDIRNSYAQLEMILRKVKISQQMPQRR